MVQRPLRRRPGELSGDSADGERAAHHDGGGPRGEDAAGGRRIGRRGAERARRRRPEPAQQRQRQRKDGRDAGADRRPRAVDELADGALGDPHPPRDRGPALAVDRGGEQRITLAGRQPAELAQRLARQRDALGDLLGAVGGRLGITAQVLAEFKRAVARGNGHPRRGVAHDLVKPGPWVRDIGASGQRGQRAQERLLDYVLGALAGAEAPRRAQQLGTVPRRDLAERVVVAPAREGGEQGVVEVAQALRRDAQAIKTSRFHGAVDAGPGPNLPGGGRKFFGKVAWRGASLTSDTPGIRRSRLMSASQHEQDDALRDAVCRGLAVLAVAGIAVIHIANASDAYDSAHYLFWLYMALVAAAVPLITLLIHERSPRTWVLVAAFATGPLVGYLWSRGIGLPGDRDDLGDWMNPLGIASLFVEASLITLSLTRLRMTHRASARRRRDRGRLTRPTTQPIGVS
jgi:hypothetical protein